MRSSDLEARVHGALAVDHRTASLHVRLPESQVDVEIRVGRGSGWSGDGERGGEQQGKGRDSHVGWLPCDTDCQPPGSPRNGRSINSWTAAGWL
jgi:hypothetical protein